MYKRKAQPRIDTVATAQSPPDPASEPEGATSGVPTGLSVAAICIVFVVVATLLLTSGPVTGGAKGIVTGLTRKGKFRTPGAVFPATKQDRTTADLDSDMVEAPTGNEGAEPWTALGISRREWLRRKLKSDKGEISDNEDAPPNVIDGDLDPDHSLDKPASGATVNEVKIVIVDAKKVDASEVDEKKGSKKHIIETKPGSKPEEIVVDDAAARDLPPYAARNSFYHQKSYKCKPLGRLQFDVPQKILANGSLAPPTGGLPTMAVMQDGSRQPSDEARHSLQLETNSVRYGAWSMSWPPFFRSKHKEWFANYEIAQWRRSTGCEQPPEKLGFCEQSYATGSISVTHDVHVAGQPNGHDCGPNGKVQILLDNGQNGKQNGVAREVDTLYWGDIPAVWTFQHWHENTLPKIANVLEFIPDFMLWDSVSGMQELLLDRFPIVKEIYNHMGWDVFDERSKAIQAKNFVYSCAVPPLQPYLWQQGQQHVLRVAPTPLESRKKIVYCGRTRKGRIENAGRRVLNEDDVLSVLRKWESQGFVVDEFDHQQHPTIPQLIEYFSDARLLIGPHGGCLTNVMFLGCNSAVIELFMLVNGVKPPVGHPAMMMYMQSTFLEQAYYMLPVHTTDSGGDITVPMDELEEVVAAALGAL